MFSKLLIANRGEIACRIQRTARALGIRTVAVYSAADANAMHVHGADEAVCVGAAPATESYLCADRILEAARQTGCDAIHPGYGFLSENAAFARSVAGAGITFIGPSAEAIDAMGLKDAAKARMVAAGVPVVPGYHGADQDVDTLEAWAADIGYPVLIKARAGGGGKGMRKVDDPADFRQALAAAQREGEHSFGDGVCLIEKYITSPRHIEIQVFGDTQGNVVHLHERDCSLQRRHQKVIEEAPAPGMTPAVRARMGEAAVTAAREIGYVGAGTIEFIVDGAGDLREDGFWFMEMNTRLQVEHPVTEAITGIDLVAWQLRVAAGQPLPLQQNEIPLNGWSVEARLYAEDPANDFLPASGPLHHLYLDEGVRIDSGAQTGDTVSTHYDPMIAKLISHAPDRHGAWQQLAQSLARSELAGTVSNLDFLSALCRHEGVRAGQVHTNLIGQSADTLTQGPAGHDEALAVAAVTALGLARPQTFEGFSLWTAQHHRCTLRDGEERCECTVTALAEGTYCVSRTDAEPVQLTRHPNGWQLEQLRCTVRAVMHGDHITVFHNGHHRFDRVDPEIPGTDHQAGGDHLSAPMPGLLRVLDAAVGDSVSQGQTLAVMEAMKMEHALVAPRDGVVAAVSGTVGMQLDQGDVIVSLEPNGHD